VNAAEFNSRYPVGTPVLAYPGIRPEDGPGERLVTCTRSVAQVLGGHTDVVWVDGHGACIALTHIDVIAEPEPEWRHQDHCDPRTSGCCACVPEETQ
jgi:hypothetical protein